LGDGGVEEDRIGADAGRLLVVRGPDRTEIRFALVFGKKIGSSRAYLLTPTIRSGSMPIDRSISRESLLKSAILLIGRVSVVVCPDVSVIVSARPSQCS